MGATRWVPTIRTSSLAGSLIFGFVASTAFTPVVVPVAYFAVMWGPAPGVS